MLLETDNLLQDLLSLEGVFQPFGGQKLLEANGFVPMTI